MRFIPDGEIAVDLKEWNGKPDAPVKAEFLVEYALALQSLRKKAIAYMNQHPKQGCDGAWADLYCEVYGRDPEDCDTTSPPPA